MRSRDRWGGLAGIASVILLVPAALVTVVSGSQPAPDASTVRIVHYLNEHRGLYLTSLFFEVVSFGLFLWFLAALLAAIAERQPATAWLGRLAFGAGVAYSLMILTEDAAFAAAARLADQDRLAASVRALWEFGYQEAWPFARPFVVLLLVSVAIAAARAGPALRRVAGLSVAAAVVNLAFLPTLFIRHGPFQPGGFLAHTTATLVFELWVLVAAFVLAIGHIPTSRSDVRS